MSTPRVQQIFEAAANQITKLGAYKFSGPTPYLNLIIAQGTDSTGRDAVLYDVDGASWSTANRRAIVVANPASDKNGFAGFKTQSHASGSFIPGSVSFQAYLESPANWTGNHAQFVRILTQHLAGQLGAPVELLFTANGTEPTLNGLNGAVATASATSGGTLLPYPMTYPGGV